MLSIIKHFCTFNIKINDCIYSEIISYTGPDLTVDVDLNMRGFLELLKFVGGSAVEKKNILV